MAIPNGSVQKRQSRSTCDSLGRIHGAHDHLDYLPRLPYKLAHSPKLRKGFACIPSMFQRIFIATGSARTRRAPMHPTSLFPLTAGDMQSFPARVLAPQRGLDSIGPVFRR